MAEFLQQDWNILREGSEELERFVLAKDLYWPLDRSSHGPHGMAQLSLGSMALSSVRLTAVEWSPQAQAELDALLQKIEAVRSQWQANWARKAEREYSARLRLWQDALLDGLAERHSLRSGYDFNVRWRTMLDLLERDSGANPPDVERATLSGLDSRLRGATRSGPFVWEPEVERGFPPERFWYLYVTFPE